ncbi:unnamed protein product [Auanema sp. JU1783]|nr:unnamed protein product [Auanema sp. JU1783]
MISTIVSSVRKQHVILFSIGLLFFIFSCFVLYTNPAKSIVLILISALLFAFYSWILSDIVTEPVRLRALGGLALLLIIALLASTNRSQISWRPVLGGITLQFLCGTIFLKWDQGNLGLQWLVTKVVGFLDYTYRGSRFVYGFATSPPPICDFSYVFVFTALQILIFFGAVVELLYHLGVIQVVLKRLAWVMSHLVGTTGSESLNAAACIFVGQTEAALLVGNSLSRLTSSELHTIMTTGFSCIAGSLFSAFIAFGACPSYLLTATVMSACVSLSFSKIVCPETEETKDREFSFAKSPHNNILECISAGATKSAGLVMAVGANLLVFLALLQSANSVIFYLGDLIGYQGLSLNRMIGWAFFPLAYMMGASDDADPEIALQETIYVAELMGIKTVLNEFLAYKHLAYLISSGKLLGARARMVATFACCGFSNISMIGSMLGTLGQLVPERKQLLAKLVVRALISGALSCFATATVAGIIVGNPVGCLPSSNTNCVSLHDLNTTFNVRQSIN